MRAIGELGQIVQEHLSEFPTIPSRRIARWINDKFPQHNIEKIRGLVRYYRGQSGVKHRNSIADNKYFSQPYDLPIPSVYDSSEFIIPEKTILALMDTQFPFQDNEAIKTAIDWAKNYNKKHNKIDAILLNGDILDCYQLSDYSRDPRERKILEEIEDMKDFLDVLREEFNVTIYWKHGNHEERYERYLFRQNKELVGLSGNKLEDQFDCSKYNLKVIKDKRNVKIGHLNVIHGHEFRFTGTTVNPARTFFLKSKAPTLGGDRHTTSEHSGRTIDGKLITCWSVGCLCQLKPKYMPFNEWNHGFALIRNEGDIFRVLNLRIENGVIY